MLYEAHKGVSTECPENTMISFVTAQKQGYDMVEMDPGVTSDGVAMVLHDATLNRTCRNADGSEIEETVTLDRITYAQSQLYDAGIAFAPEFAGEKLPRLADVLAFAGKTGIQVKMDNKLFDFSASAMEAVLKTIEEAALGAQVGFTFSRLSDLDYILERFPEAALHYDGPVSEQDLRQVSAKLGGRAFTCWIAIDNASTWWVRVPKASPELCGMIHRFASLGVWILEDQKDMDLARSLGADIIETHGLVKPGM